MFTILRNVTAETLCDTVRGYDIYISTSSLRFLQLPCKFLNYHLS